MPAGIQAALEHRFTDLGVPAVGLWAQVPHYVSGFPYPAASVALLDGPRRGEPASGSRRVSCGEAAANHRQQLDELVAGNAEHIEMVRQLEQAYDQEESDAQPLGFGGDLPSGDELAAEVERFLREQGR